MKKFFPIAVLFGFVVPSLIGIPLFAQWLGTNGPRWVLCSHAISGEAIVGPGTAASLIVAWAIAAIIGGWCIICVTEFK